MLFRDAIAKGFAVGLVYQAGSRAGLIRYCVVIAVQNDTLVVYDPTSGRYPVSRYRLPLVVPRSYAPNSAWLERARRATVPPGETLWRLREPWPRSLVGGVWDTPLQRGSLGG